MLHEFRAEVGPAAGESDEAGIEAVDPGLFHEFACASAGPWAEGACHVGGFKDIEIVQHGRTAESGEVGKGGGFDLATAETEDGFNELEEGAPLLDAEEFLDVPGREWTYRPGGPRRARRWERGSRTKGSFGARVGARS